ncbi:hypothetical protein KKB55_15555 [Myxococcota bacterium]|nr:hypothetical protein [Myxococcota bacterium]
MTLLGCLALLCVAELGRGEGATPLKTAVGCRWPSKSGEKGGVSDGAAR